MQKQYDADVLERLKKAERDILIEFDRVCQLYGIHYFLDEGSLLGTIRHKGFIPWDDDLDIGMMREDYDKFLNIMHQELGENYILATPITHIGYCSAVIKLMRKNTKFVPEFSMEMRCELGIHIDIFVWDNLCDNKISAWLQMKKARMLSQLIFLCGSSKPNIKYTGMLKFILQKICEAIHFILCRIPNCEKVFYQYFEKVSKRENHKNTKYVTCFQYWNPIKAIYKKEDFFPYLQKEFEGFMVFVPNNYKENLRQCYGDDYMKLPPVEKRKNHCAEIIDFGDIY